jgi:7,8-dihydropterin-6-yl-methyl-4-(beta-D-ribofuranosyl)aminobenzene 5'-phosphate synthase
MRLTVLVDNNASRNLAGEWGLSIFIEAEEQKVLFDLGASDLFLRNAARLNIDLMNLDYLILSHGHYDHTWGLDYWLKQRVKSLRKVGAPPTFLAHPSALKPKFRDDMTEFGMIASEIILKRYFKTVFSKEPVHLTKELVFLGQIERRFEFENNHPLGKTLESNGSFVDDYLMDDTALVYKTAQGIVIITGCSHSGICNIIEYARKVCHDERVVDIIGGLHLLGLENGDRQLEETLMYFTELNPGQIHPCHCTDLKAKIALARVTRLEEVNVGFTVEY